jgi:hypothetical protein
MDFNKRMELEVTFTRLARHGFVEILARRYDGLMDLIAEHNYWSRGQG